MCLVFCSVRTKKGRWEMGWSKDSNQKIIYCCKFHEWLPVVSNRWYRQPASLWALLILSSFISSLLYGTYAVHCSHTKNYCSLKSLCFSTALFVPLQRKHTPQSPLPSHCLLTILGWGIYSFWSVFLRLNHLQFHLSCVSLGADACMFAYCLLLETKTV